MFAPYIPVIEGTISTQDLVMGDVSSDEDVPLKDVLKANAEKQRCTFIEDLQLLELFKHLSSPSSLSSTITIKTNLISKTASPFRNKSSEAQRVAWSEREREKASKAYEVTSIGELEEKVRLLHN